MDLPHIKKTEKILIKGMTLSELENYCISIGENRFRGVQIFEWLYRHGVSLIDEMTNISKSFRNILSEKVEINTLTLAKVSKSQLEPTQKLLFKLFDNNYIETVSMIHEGRHTVCISSQIGCALACDFCATGKMGLTRNLTSGEIIDQLIHVQKLVDFPISNVVFMGMGEPFHNYDNVMKASEIMHEQLGFNLASNRITISTAGVVPKIQQFVDEDRKYNLAISLNASHDSYRDKIMPINKKWKIDELVNVARQYSNKKRKNVMFEYVLLEGINDSDDDAYRLIKLLKGSDAKLNIIPYNETGKIYKRTDKTSLNRFAKILFDAQDGYRVLVRWSRGTDIDAACGQLASKGEK